MKTGCDVVVAGGGSAGVAAAISAARLGARTLLVEQQAQLGGMGSHALVHTLCGLFHPDTSRSPQWLNPGLPTEIGQRMLELTGQSQPDLMGRVYVLRHRPALLAQLMLELCRAEPRLSVALGKTINGLKRSGDGSWSAIIDGEPLTAAALVDTTGDALLARLLGPEHWQIADSSHLYRPAYISHFRGFPAALDEQTILEAMTAIVRAVRKGLLPEAALGATLRKAPDGDEIFISIDLSAGGGHWDPFNADCIKAIAAEARTTSEALHLFLRRELPAFATAGELEHPVQLGVRESACWRGDTVLTAADLIGCRRFEIEAALAGWPLEMRETARGPRFRFFDRPEPAGIPTDCLRSRAASGIFFAGRCLSCDHEALASVRVMGTCLATGQAAGRLAAEHARVVCNSET